MALKLETLKAGQNVKLSITKVPTSASSTKTVERLMRMEQKTKVGLRKAHAKRMKGLVVYNRGNRDWTKRESCGKLVRVAAGQTWTMCYTVDMARELSSVAKFVSVEKA